MVLQLLVDLCDRVVQGYQAHLREAELGYHLLLVEVELKQLRVVLGSLVVGNHDGGDVLPVLNVLALVPLDESE